MARKKYMTKDAAFTKATGMDAPQRDAWRVRMDELLLEAKQYPVGHPRRKEIENEILFGKAE